MISKGVLGPKKLYGSSLYESLKMVMNRVSKYMNTSTAVMKKMKDLIVKVGQNVNFSIWQKVSFLGSTYCWFLIPPSRG